MPIDPGEVDAEGKPLAFTLITQCPDNITPAGCIRAL
jgi:hypothetical protein